MLSTRIWIVPIDAGQENRRSVMHTVRREVMKALAYILALDITV